MRLAPGSTLGPYEVLAMIGAGGSGEVWTARDTRSNAVVAIKQLKAAHMTRYRADATAVATLRHPNICSLFEVGPDYLVMEYVEGPTLRGPMAAERAIRLAAQIANALEAAHEQGILHGDLKPGNVIVTHGAAKLLDFGVARARAKGATDKISAIAGAITGLAYESPEQAEGRALDARSDIFSFGALLYEMLSGHRAFTGGSTADVVSAILRDEPQPVPMSEALARVVWGCLKKNPDERFQRMAEVTAALDAAT